MYRKSVQKLRLEAKRKRCAAMRAIKERKRLTAAQAAVCVGIVVFDGAMFGGKHTLRCWDFGDERMVWIEIDGQHHKPRSWRGVLRLIAKRLTNSRRI
jgi:hypothetical protein